MSDEATREFLNILKEDLTPAGVLEHLVLLESATLLVASGKFTPEEAADAALRLLGLSAASKDQLAIAKSAAVLVAATGMSKEQAAKQAGELSDLIRWRRDG